MSNSKLINYTTQDFQTEKDLELNDYRWNQIKDKYLPKLKENGLLRMVLCLLRLFCTEMLLFQILFIS